VRWVGTSAFNTLRLALLRAAPPAA
jgi:hypothetical protein